MDSKNSDIRALGKSESIQHREWTKREKWIRIIIPFAFVPFYLGGQLDPSHPAHILDQITESLLPWINGAVAIMCWGQLLFFQPRLKIEVDANEVSNRESEYLYALSDNQKKKIIVSAFGEMITMLCFFGTILGYVLGYLPGRDAVSFSIGFLFSSLVIGAYSSRQIKKAENYAKYNDR